MRITSSRDYRTNWAFTLIELLVVIAIIGIIAALLMPAVSATLKRAKVARANIEIADIVNAIQRYHTTYGRYPASAGAIESVLPPAPGVAKPEDFTYGGTFFTPGVDIGSMTIRGAGQLLRTNNEVIAILMSLTNYSNGEWTINTNNVKNPQQIKFLNAKMTDDPVLGGVAPDLIYRDPWGNPYIISLDLNYDEKCHDAFYRRDDVSKDSGTVGFNGLQNSSGLENQFGFNGGVMVWSLGPDRKADDSVKANVGVNRDNVLSWK